MRETLRYSQRAIQIANPQTDLAPVSLGLQAELPLLIMDNGKYVDTILSEEGVKQGDTLGSLLFALSMQRLYRRCTEGIPEVKYVAVADDQHIWQPRRRVSCLQV